MDRKDRRCWLCKKTGHSSALCPSKKPGAALRTVAEEAESAIRRIGVVGYAGSEDGYVPARKTFRPPPRPTDLKVKHFMQNNRFSGFSQREKKAAAAKQSFSKAQALEASTPGPATNAKIL